MKRHISVFMFFLSIFAAVGSVRASVQYWAVSTHPCTITDFDGELLSFDVKDVDNGGYYFSKYKAGDYGVTDLNINESGDCDRITAQEPKGFRFKGWWTKKDGWTGGEAYVGEINVCIETNRTITGGTIKNAGQWGGRPTIVAKYVPIYTISTAVSPAGAGTVTGGATVESGGSVKLTAMANDDWTFQKWSDGVTTNPRTIDGIAADATYTAVFQEKPIRNLTFEFGKGIREIRYKIGDGDEVAVSATTTVSVRDGRSWMATATAMRGYSDPTRQDGTATADSTIKFNGSLHQYKIEYDPQGGAKRGGGKYPTNENFGDVFRVSPPVAKAGEDRTFLGWTVVTNKDDLVCAKWGTSENAVTSDISPSSYCSNGEDDVWFCNLSSVNGDEITLKAVWSGLMRTIAVSADPSEGGRVSGGGRVAEGGDVILTATANDGYAFVCWKKGGTEVSKANPYAFRVSGDSAGDYTAVFCEQTYTVSFFGNGGTNEMASQRFEYNEPKELASNKFERAGFDFAGWLTDPTNAAPTYADGEIVSNLSARLFAAWTPAGAPPAEATNYLDNAYSVAADCATNRADGAVALELSTDFDSWCTVLSNVTDFGENRQCIKMMAENKENQVRLYTKIPGSGKFEFYYKMNMQYPEDGILSIKTNEESNALFEISEKKVDWTKCSIDLCSQDDVDVIFLFEIKSLAIGDGDYVLIDDIRWIPDDQPKPPEPVDPTTVGVTLRLNDWTPAPDDVYTNMTFEVGDEIGALPSPGGVGEFKGWFTVDNVAVTNEWPVPPKSVQLHAEWERGVVEIPTAVGGLVYDGGEKTGVLPGAGYSLAGHKATVAGYHSATATLVSADSVWSDGVKTPKEIAWFVARSSHDMSGVTFPDATFAYDGEEHSFGVVGTVPDGVTVTYFGKTSRTEVGTDTVTASFTVADSANWNAVTNRLTAKLAVLPMTNEIPAAIKGLVYDGNAKTGVVEGAGYSLAGNVATAAGNHTAFATPEKGHVWSDGSAGPVSIAWSIAKGTPDVSGVTFPNATFEYDGEEHSFGIAGALPPGIEVAYDGKTSRRDVGTSTVTASFVVTDLANWNAIAKTLTASLVITPKAPGPTPAPDDGALYPGSEIGIFDASAAATYNGWIEDPVTSNLLAALQVKTAAAKPGRERKTTIYVTPVGGKKKTYKSTIVESGDRQADGYGIVYGALGLTGSTHGFVGVPDGARVQAAKDFTKARDPAEKVRVARIPIGTWTIAAETASGGYDCLSVAVAKTGKATVKGTLSDGTKVSISGYGALGADAFVVPVSYSKYIKPKNTGVRTHVEFAGLLWIATGGSAALVSGSARWVDAKAAKLGAFSPNAWKIGLNLPNWRTYLMKTNDGYDVTPVGLSVNLTAARKFAVPKTSGSVKVDKATGMTSVKPSGKNVPANLSKFKLTLVAKTGQVKGSFRLYHLDGGKLKADSVAVTGIMVDGRFHGNATVKKIGTAVIWLE